MSPELFIAPDGDNEDTIWQANGDTPTALLRKCDLPSVGRELLWLLLVGAIEGIL